MKTNNKISVVSIIIIAMICIAQYNMSPRQYIDLSKKAEEAKQIQDSIEHKKAEEAKQIVSISNIKAETNALREKLITEEKVRSETLDRSQVMTNWSYYDTIDDMTGERTVGISMASSSGARGIIGNDQPYLHIQCRDNTTVTYIDMDSTMKVPYSEHLVHVLWKYGSQDKAVSRSFVELSNNRGFWFNKPIPVIKEMMKEKTLKIRTSQMYSDRYAVAEFDLTNLSTAIEPIREVCNW